jgi:hypothetical protein
MSGGFREFATVLGYALFVGALAAVVFRYTVGWVQYGALALLVALAIYLLSDLRKRFGRG